MIKAYYVMRKDLDMPPAKLAVEVGHGTQILMENAFADKIKDWEENSDSRKIVCQISSQEKLYNLHDALLGNVPMLSKITDSGYTFFNGPTLTGIVFMVDDQNVPDSVLKKIKRLQLYS